MSLKDNAKYLRSHITDTENKLWYHLRGHRFAGLKFKRQKPIGAYIVDFACMQQKLIIEVDGSQHLQSETDKQRDAWLNKQGFRVLRFNNNDVLLNLDAVLEAIYQAIFNAPSPLTSLPQAGEGNDCARSHPMAHTKKELSTMRPASLLREDKEHSPRPLVGEGLGRGQIPASLFVSTDFMD